MHPHGPGCPQIGDCGVADAAEAGAGPLVGRATGFAAGTVGTKYTGKVISLTDGESLGT